MIAELSEIQQHDIPTHIAAIMDGNGRWAKERGLKRTQGHEAGEHALFEAVEGCLAAEVRWLTVYGFSTENWRRPVEEVQFLLNFNRDLLYRRRDELNERNVRIIFSGRRDRRVPRPLVRDIDEAAALTAKNTGMTLNIAFNYGGRAEIVDAIAAIIKAGTPPNKVDESMVARYLYHPDIPDPELMIRTSGEQRISNFLLWELAYSELVFTDTKWPDFTRKHLWGAIAEYQQRQRRFGGL